MDQIRILLWVALLTMLWLGFSQWTEDYGTPPPPPGAVTDTPDALPDATPLPDVAEQPALPGTSAPQTTQTPGQTVRNEVRVITDVLDVITPVTDSA